MKSGTMTQISPVIRAKLCHNDEFHNGRCALSC